MIKRRSAFFISGFDPRGSRFYRNLLFRESKKQAAVSGYGIETRNISRDHWQVEWSEDGNSTTLTNYHFLDYTELIRSEWSNNELTLLGDFFRFYSDFFLTPIGVRCLKYNWPSVVAASYPIMVAGIILSLLTLLTFLLFTFSPLSASLNVGIVIVAFAMSLFLGRLIDKKLNHYWILRSISFLGANRYESNSLFQPTLERFVEKVKQASEHENPDEIVIIGHSVGSALALELAHELLELDPTPPNVCLISLGSCYHYKATNRKNVHFRQIVERLISQETIDWIDLAAHADGAAICQVHPLIALTGKNVKDLTPLPRLYHSRFFKCFSEDGYQKLKKDPLRLHFQYLHATELPGPYDYFRMVCGPRLIRDQNPEEVNS